MWYLGCCLFTVHQYITIWAKCPFCMRLPEFIVDFCSLPIYPSLIPFFPLLVEVSCPPFLLYFSMISRTMGHIYWKKELLPLAPGASLDWPAVFQVPYKTTRETKLQSFAFKIMYRLIPCNRYLCQVRIKNSDTCAFCNETDSLSHFFLKYKAIRPFWKQLFEWCETFLDLPLANLSEAELLLGVTNRAKDQRISNWLILFAKFFIQKRKLFSQWRLPFLAFLREARVRVLTEKRACWRENGNRKFRPWQRLHDALG